ncbi:MAG: polysaccharide deacetylase family protein [Kofleriaceae bacterium]
MRALVKNAVFDRIPGLLRRGPSTTRRIALTFDDGPDRLTAQYLDLLDKLGVPATFFVIGEYAVERRDLMREYMRRGHQIASHGYDHTRFTKLGLRALLNQCARTEQSLGGQLSGRPWVRPPHGSVDASSLVTLLAAGYTVALWSLDSCDHSDQDPASIAARCAPEQVSPGEVLLFHEGQQWTLDALPTIVTSLQAAGYECVTMHDLFAA